MTLTLIEGPEAGFSVKLTLPDKWLQKPLSKNTFALLSTLDRRHKLQPAPPQARQACKRKQ